MEPARILVVEDDREMRMLLRDELTEAGYLVDVTENGEAAIERVRESSFDAVITDLVMPEMRGDELLRQLRERVPHLPVIIMTAFGSIESAVEAMRGGAYHYITKPFPLDRLVATLDDALAERRLRAQLDPEPAHAPDLAGIVTASPGFRRTFETIRRAAPADTPVLIVGESGTGKELLARALHAASPRRDRPFIAINCSAIPESLLESQLFGYRRGAFTDAREDRLGLFQEAEGGTILLDEIGDMTPALQSKLLRVLQQREVHPLGAPQPVPVDVRLVAATHRDLEAFIAEGRFRQDLLYRLNVITVTVPPLRERPEDLVPLIAHFLDKHGRRLGRAGVTVNLEAMERLRRHAWPGNVRELENVIERALVLGQHAIIGVQDLPEGVRGMAPDDAGPEAIRLLADTEREQILRALRRLHGNKAAAARMLGLDRKTLYRKLELYGIREF